MQQLLNDPTEFDQAVASTPAISNYCSSSDWALAAWSNIHGHPEPFVFKGDGAWIALVKGEHPSLGNVLFPFEAIWGFSCPLIGPDYRTAVQLLLECLENHSDEWNAVLLSGISPLMAQEVAPALEPGCLAIHKTGVNCQVSSLDGGMTGFLGRRKSKFRANLRKDYDRVIDAGATLTSFDPDDTLENIFRRIQAVEEHGWKAQAGQSIFASELYASFYFSMMQRAQARGSLRGAFATIRGTDVAYVVGGVLENTYRGYQLGYHKDVKHLGLGNVVQQHLIESLCSEGIAIYDLGMEMDYKARWSDAILRLDWLTVIREPAGVIAR